MPRPNRIILSVGDLVSDPVFISLPMSERGALLSALLLSSNSYGAGPFVRDGKPLKPDQLGLELDPVGRKAYGPLQGLLRKGLIKRDEAGAMYVSLPTRSKRYRSVPDQVQKDSPLSPITPIPPTQKSKEKEGRGASEDWGRLLTDKLKSAKPVAEAWASWISHVAGLMRLTEEKLRQDVRRMTEIHDEAGEDALVSAMTWAVSCGYRTITKEPKPKSRNKPKNSQPSAADDADGFSSRHRPNVL